MRNNTKEIIAWFDNDSDPETDASENCGDVPDGTANADDEVEVTPNARRKFSFASR